MKVDLEKIDSLRARVDLTYEEASAYLEAAGGDLVRALIMAERDFGSSVDDGYDGSGIEPDGYEFEEASTWAARLAETVRRGSAMRLVVERDGTSVAHMPVAAGLVGAIFAPELAAVGAIVALATRCTLRLEQSQSE
ncbi:MAG: DUF4342 domain-containing protein [Firmicutes bacterium]|nr:DUF4342 domain-containing protein [Bacillota bacterium]MDD4336602.1 DUF4342 domain-containing protein [Bacillota bacterium]MDD4791686.1 DUF4342 domain-containing protein [Bacillota bacterium]